MNTHPDLTKGRSTSLVGTVAFASGETASYTDPNEYLKVIKEELPFHNTTGFHFQTVSNDLRLRAEIEYLLHDFFGIDPDDCTNMEGVKDVAHVLLMCDLVKTEFSPFIVQHPFTNSGITMMPGNDGHDVIDITADPEKLTRWQAYMKGQIDSAENASQIFHMLNTPYSLTFLKHAKPHLSKEDFSRLLTSAWLMSEYANCNADVSRRQLVSMFQSADPRVLMDADELEQLEALDNPVSVYRGVTSYNGKNIRALSWTLEKETAEWFAHRFGEDGTVYEAKIDKKHILALFNGRNEAEIVLNPRHLMDITPTQSQTQGGMNMR